MAFFGRFGSILKQAAIANKQITSEFRSTLPFSQAMRCMSSTPTSKLFIGGISYSTDEQSLREAFSKYGEVIDARIILDRDTGRSRGFGFVTFTSAEEASSAIQALDGQDLHGRRVRVNYAAERPRGFGGGGGYGSAPYGAGAGYGGAYGNAPYGAAGTDSGGSYGNTGAYDGNVAGGYGGSGGNFGGSYGNGMNYRNDGNFTSGSTGSYGGNTGNFDVAGSSGGSDSYGSAAGFGSNDNYSSSSFGGSNSYVNTGASGSSDGFAGSGYDGNTMGYGSGGAGASGNFASGYDGSGGQLDSKESSNISEDVGDFGEPSEGNYRDDNDDTSDFAKRA